MKVSLSWEVSTNQSFFKFEMETRFQGTVAFFLLLGEYILYQNRCFFIHRIGGGAFVQCIKNIFVEDGFPYRN